MTNMHEGPILRWLATTGAAGDDEVALACGITTGAARARLRALQGDGLARSERLLHGAPALHVLTRAGLRAAGRPELGVVALSASSFAHHLAVGRVAAALTSRGAEVCGERELRVWECAEGRALASAEVGYLRDGSIALHRPDLVCTGAGLPIAIEVELTVKAPERLRAIVRGWARSRVVAGVVYYAAPAAARALARALRSEYAEGRVAVLALERAGELPPFDRRVPTQAGRSVGRRIESLTARRP